jgi:cysteine-rich repeat protein
LTATVRAAAAVSAATAATAAVVAAAAVAVLSAGAASASGCAHIQPADEAGPGGDAALDSGASGGHDGGDGGGAGACGDGVVDPGEACDDGNNGQQTDDCLDGCIAASCGDGFVRKGVEVCDDGNDVDGDGCNAACVPDCAVFGSDAWGYLGCAERPVALPCDELAGAGTDAGLTDDSWAWVPIGFDFDFYGVARSMVAISANGTLTFEDAAVSPQNACIPGAATGGPETVIAAFWDDLRPGPGLGTVRYAVLGAAPARRFVVEWQVPHFPDSPSLIVVRAMLHEDTGDIDLCYPDVSFGEPAYDGGAAAVVGIQNTAALGTGFLCRDPTLADGTVLRYAHP